MEISGLIQQQLQDDDNDERKKGPTCELAKFHNLFNENFYYSCNDKEREKVHAGATSQRAS
jgi:uncharacterized protein YfeS